MASIPTLREELDRKTFETLETLISGFGSGRFNKEQFSMGLDVLFMNVSGLVDKEFIGLFTEASKLLEGENT